MPPAEPADLVKARRPIGRRLRFSSAARKRKFTCVRILRRCSRRRSPLRTRNSRSGRTFSRRWNLSATITRRCAGTSSRCRASRRTAEAEGRAGNAIREICRGRRRGEEQPKNSPICRRRRRRLRRLRASTSRKRHRLHFRTDRSRLVADRVRPGSRRGNRRRHKFHRRHALTSTHGGTRGLSAATGAARLRSAVTLGRRQALRPAVNLTGGSSWVSILH